MNDNINLIIIDQLRNDYLKHLPKCREVLRYSGTCSCNSIPTSTEPMHANISTGHYPGVHQLVSKYTATGKNGIENLIYEFQEPTISQIAFEFDYQVNVIGGKDDVVSIMAFNSDFITYGCCLEYANGKQFARLWGNGKDMARDIIDSCKLDGRIERIDHNVLKVYRTISNEHQGKQFWIIGLPLLDTIGHKYGPMSSETIKHIETCLNERLRRN